METIKKRLQRKDKKELLEIAKKLGASQTLILTMDIAYIKKEIIAWIIKKY